MIKQLLHWTFVIFVYIGTALIFGGILYLTTISPAIYNYRLKKAKKLYPEFYATMEQRDSISLNESYEASTKIFAAENSIDAILKEMPYTLNEDKPIKELEIEALQRKRFCAKTDYKKWQKEIERLNEQLDKMISESELLTKLYRNNW